MAAPPAPLPPAVSAQSTPEGAQSAFASQGIGQAQPGMEAVQGTVRQIGEILGLIQQIETKLDDVYMSTIQIQSGLKGKAGIAAAALKDLQGSLVQLARQSGMAFGSPVMPGQQPSNPAAGPPNPMMGQV